MELHRLQKILIENSACLSTAKWKNFAIGKKTAAPRYRGLEAKFPLVKHDGVMTDLEEITARLYGEGIAVVIGLTSIAPRKYYKLWVVEMETGWSEALMEYVGFPHQCLLKNPIEDGDGAKIAAVELIRKITKNFNFGFLLLEPYWLQLQAFSAVPNAPEIYESIKQYREKFLNDCDCYGSDKLETKAIADGRIFIC